VERSTAIDRLTFGAIGKAFSTQFISPRAKQGV
jgi:hypothetical protein